VATHEVFNVPAPWSGVNLFADDRSLLRRVTAASGITANSVEVSGLTALGALAGGAEAQDWARLANSHPPELRTHDRYGHRIDEVEFHPAWHQLVTVAVGNGLHGSPWAANAGPNAHLVRAAGFYVWSQVEQGHGCPISMTYAAVPALRHNRELTARYEPGLLSRNYDFGLRPSESKRGLLAGMAMTEKQGGSDVRANTTSAEPAADGAYRITGHKWFCSAPMCDLFLVLAQAPGGLSCFVVPRMLPDGTRNVFNIQRLKNKLGNRSNASSEVEFDQTIGWLVGDEGRGVRTIIDMVTMTRLDCVIGSAAIQRAALTQAMHHVNSRAAFGTRLVDQPLMQEVIADLAIEVEATAALFTRLAHAVDAGESELLRLAVAASKFWVCKRTPTVVGEALECLGGAGFVEESPLPRYFRESPLNSIWEGSGNVIALDVVRAVRREPAAVAALQVELACSAGLDPRLDDAITRLNVLLGRIGTDPDQDARSARVVSSLLARTLQGSLLVRAASDQGASAIAEVFLDSRLGPFTASVAASARTLSRDKARQVIEFCDPNAG
jgi:putative acyl-CoA dehydrogenase